METYSPERTHAELLSGIHEEIQLGQSAGNSARPFAPFGALLIKLSKEADKTADKNLRIADEMLEIAKITKQMQDRALFVSIVGAIFAALSFFIVLPVDAKHVEKNPKNDKQADNLHQTDKDKQIK